MILSCNSCEKKFVVPDHAITAGGRTVQCGSCGNKWKQFPLKSVEKKDIPNNKIITKKITNIPKTPKIKKKKKTREINLYSPEYLEKKHGISLSDTKTIAKKKPGENVNFGFYNSLILFIVLAIALFKSLHFFQDFIVLKIPITEFYLDYFFESIQNIFEIWINLISKY